MANPQREGDVCSSFLHLSAPNSVHRAEKVSRCLEHFEVEKIKDCLTLSLCSRYRWRSIPKRLALSKLTSKLRAHQGHLTANTGNSLPKDFSHYSSLLGPQGHASVLGI